MLKDCGLCGWMVVVLSLSQLHMNFGLLVLEWCLCRRGFVCAGGCLFVLEGVCAEGCLFVLESVCDGGCLCLRVYVL